MAEFKTYVVRPRISSTDEDPIGKALAKHDMSKFAGCPDIYFGAVFDRNLDRYLTGLDETHPDVLILPAEEREAKQNEILEERTALEKEIGESLLHTNTEYWSNLKIVLDRGMAFNTKSAKDRLILKVLKAGKMVPFGRDAIHNPEFIGCNYFIGNEFEDVADKTVERSKARKMAIALEELLDNYDQAIQVGQYLGIEGINNGIPKANLDDLLSTFIEKKLSNREAFLEAVKLDPEHISLFNLFREFKTLRLVKYDDGRWMSGKVKLGKTEKEAVKNLLSNKPEMQAEKAKLIEDYQEATQRK